MADKIQTVYATIGPSFEAEWRAAGISGNGFSWSNDRVTIMPDIIASQKALLLRVIKAHNPLASVDFPEAPNLELRTSKTAFWRRTTEEEAAGFIADLAEVSPKLKALFDAVSYLIPGTPEYPMLRAAIENRVGPERADELLAPSGD